MTLLIVQPRMELIMDRFLDIIFGRFIRVHLAQKRVGVLRQKVNNI